jgi:hypothetical protein
MGDKLAVLKTQQLYPKKKADPNYRKHKIGTS